MIVADKAVFMIDEVQAICKAYAASEDKARETVLLAQKYKVPPKAIRELLVKKGYGVPGVEPPAAPGEKAVAIPGSHDTGSMVQQTVEKKKRGGSISNEEKLRLALRVLEGEAVEVVAQQAGVRPVTLQGWVDKERPAAWGEEKAEDACGRDGDGPCEDPFAGINAGVKQAGDKKPDNRPAVDAAERAKQAVSFEQILLDGAMACLGGWSAGDGVRDLETARECIGMVIKRILTAPGET